MKKNHLLLLLASLAFFACSETTSPEKDDDVFEPGKSLVFTFHSDYTSGELRWFSPDSLRLSESSLEFNQDSRLGAIDSLLFVLERYGADNLVLVNPKLLPEASAVVYQKALETGANPSDLVKINSETAWLAQENSSDLLKINMEDGSTNATVDLSDFAYAGALSPNLVDLEISGDTLFALIQRLDGYDPVIPGMILLLSAKNGSFLDSIPLQTTNPSAMALLDGNIYVSTQGAYNADYELEADSLRGLEQVKIAAKTSELFTSGKELGGGAQSLTLDRKNKIAYTSIYADYSGNKIVSVNLKNGEVSNVESVGGSSPILYDAENETLWVGDNASSEIFGLRGKTKQSVTSSEILPPYGLAIVNF
ncbi:MAG: hypothetical protein LBR60_09445 [Fibrobacter sp.]|nr:hypothetical protein [Fibrobacter sp.]